MAPSPLQHLVWAMLHEVQWKEVLVSDEEVIRRLVQVCKPAEVEVPNSQVAQQEQLGEQNLPICDMILCELTPEKICVHCEECSVRSIGGAVGRVTKKHASVVANTTIAWNKIKERKGTGEKMEPFSQNMNSFSR